MLEFLTGFDNYNNGTAYYFPSSGLAQEFDALAAVAVVTGRFGGYAARTYNLLRKFLPAGALPTRTFGFAFYAPTASNFTDSVMLVSFYDQSALTSQLELTYHFSTQQITLTRNGTLLGTCAGTYPPNAWYYLEVQATIDNAAGAVTVNLYPGGTVLTLSNIDTQASANASASAISWGQGEGVVWIDDVYVTNPTGGVHTGFLGECRVLTALPTGDSAVNHAFTPSTGVSHFACVEQADPATDAPSAQATAVGAIDTYTFGLPAFSGSIVGVKASVSARKDDVGARTLASEFRDNAGVEHTGAAAALLSTYKFVGTIWDTNPATGAAWTAADFAGAEFGMKVIS